MKKVLSAGLMLLAGVLLPGARAQEIEPAPQSVKEVVEAAKPKTPGKRGAKTKPAKTAAAKMSSKQSTPAAAQTETTASVVNPKDAASYYDIGLGHYESKRFREAVEAFKQSIRLGSTDPKTYFTLGQAYYSLGLYREAREAYKRVVRLKPDWAEAHYQLGWMYHILGDEEAAREQYKILQTLSPETAANFQKLLVDDVQTAAAANAAENNRGLTNGATNNGAINNGAVSNQETTKASLSDAAALVKTQEPASTPETATQTTSAPASVVKQTSASEATSASTADSAAAHNVTDLSSAGASPASANSAPTSAKQASSTAKDETTTEAVVVSSSELPLTSVYRIGIGDVLDIRLLNSATGRSTLFTVMNGGLIEYPLVGGSFTVAGLTTDEIGSRLAAELKRRGINIDSPVVVSVRDYTSHTAIVSGLVNYPGKRILRREATPLYVIIAEAQLRPEASRAVIMRGNEPIQINDLTDPMALNVVVKADDVITISARQLQYYFIGGRINSPGQKTYQQGLTLIQAILAAGGLSRSQETVEISREETDGRLMTTKYVLKEIKAGKIPDPRIQPGDRIEVGH